MNRQEFIELKDALKGIKNRVNDQPSYFGMSAIILVVAFAFSNAVPKVLDANKTFQCQIINPAHMSEQGKEICAKLLAEAEEN